MGPTKTPVSCARMASWLVLALLSGCATPSRPPVSDNRGHMEKAVVRPDAEPIRQALAGIIRRVQKKYQIPGISLILVRNGDTLWAEGFGYADRKRGIPATADTVFRAGSIAKLFTAMAVMQLEEAGKLDIDQPLTAYLPEFSIRSRFDTTAEPITVRSILCHHSGLPTDLNKGMWSATPFTEVATRLNEEYTAFPPNLVFSYSNIGYTLLGHMIQEVSGEAYPQYMQEHLFRPLGMRRSGMVLSPEMAPYLATGYRKGEAAELLPIRDLPAYALYTTADDLGRFMKMVLARGRTADNRIVMSETLEEMLEPQNADIALDLNVINGLGWFLEQGTISGGGRVVRHGGTTLLYSSELIMLPERGLGVAVLANSSGSRDLVSQLAEQILKVTLDSERGSGPVLVQEEVFSREVSAPLPAEPGGNYATDLGLISIRPKDAKLCACIIEETFDMIPYPNGWFGVSRNAVDSLPPSYKVLGKLRFKTERIDGIDVIVAQKGEKQVVLGEKIPVTPIPDVWRKRVGNYRLTNPDEKFPLIEPKVMVSNGQLFMSYKMPLLSNRPVRVPLRPISDTEAVILGLGRARGETLRAVIVDRRERLRYSGFEGMRREPANDHAGGGRASLGRIQENGQD